MTESLAYAEIDPPPTLRSWIRCIWRLTGPAAAVAEPEPIIPDGCVELVVNLADAVIRNVPGRGSHLQPMQLVAGEITRAISVQPSGRVDLWGVRFHPWTASRFLGMSGIEMRDRIVALDDVARPLSRDLSVVAEVVESEQGTRLVRALERRASRIRGVDAVVPRLANSALENPETTSVRTMARAAGMSTRRVQMLFRDEIGLSPKQLLRITRFQRALGVARANPALSWAAVAVAAGYFDHAHLIHESREIAGCTPAALLGREAELTAAFLTPSEAQLAQSP